MRRVAVVFVLAGMAGLLAPCTASFRLDSGDGAAGAAGDPVHILVWSGRALPEALTAAASRIPGVIAVGSRRTGTVDLRAAPGASRPLPARPHGTIVPVAITAIDPAVLRTFPAQRAAAEVLSRGEAIVPSRSASYRGLEPGDALQLAGGGRSIRVRVGAVVPEDRLIRGEVVLSDALVRSIGVHRPPALLLAVAPQAAAAAEAAMVKAIGTFPARMRSGSLQPSPSSAPGGQLSLLELKQIFGEFWYRRNGGRWLTLNPAWVQANIVKVRLPILGVIECNRRIVPLINGAMSEIQARGLAHLITSSEGCFSPRVQVADGETISRHAFGVAFDINAGTNGFGDPPTLDRRLVDIIERWGFTWGGRWTVPDGMHFEFSGFPQTTPR